jgi:hypothetical protein
MIEYVCQIVREDGTEDGHTPGTMKARAAGIAAELYVAKYDREAVEYPPERFVLVSDVGLGQHLLYRVALRPNPQYTASVVVCTHKRSE